MNTCSSQDQHNMQASVTPIRDEILNLGVCPDKASNPQPLWLWERVGDKAPTNWATWPILPLFLFLGFET